MDSGRCLFRVWAPAVSTVELILAGPTERVVPLVRSADGYFSRELENIPSGTLYRYRLDGEEDRPDPASRFQPQGVHGPSQVIEPSFPWADQNALDLPLKDYVIYELHVGAFTADGTFDAIMPHLPELKDLGITAIELMPVTQFPGSRNWGYDSVQPFAVQDSYGGPQGLKRLVNACHQIGLAVILDVVYNHLGPEGNYLADFGPYFTDRYKTPWGLALNFDGPDSEPVRRYFIDNALYWVQEFHIDALRLDAVHAILDHSPYSFLEQLADEVHQTAKTLNRRVFLFPESAANDSRLIRAREFGGYGFDAQWNDDFHHALRAVLTGERGGYYVDYGEFHQLVKAYREGFVYSGEYSQHRRRRHGTVTQDIPAERFVVFCAKPRSGGKPHVRRAAQPTGFLRTVEACRRRGRPIAVYPVAFHGRGVWRGSAVSIFHQPFRGAIGRSGAQRPAPGICRLQMARGTAGPAGRSDVFARQVESPTQTRRQVPHALAVLSRGDPPAQGTFTLSSIEQGAL